jgi:hypothetical protein
MDSKITNFIHVSEYFDMVDEVDHEIYDEVVDTVMILQLICFECQDEFCYNKELLKSAIALFYGYHSIYDLSVICDFLSNFRIRDSIWFYLYGYKVDEWNLIRALGKCSKRVRS